MCFIWALRVDVWGPFGALESLYAILSKMRK